jgi:uncharacterized membrane protein (DUF106 family)
MAAFVLIIAIIVLVLLLTGTLGAVLIGTLQLAGWTLVALLVAILVWELFQPIQRRMDQRRRMRSLVAAIKHMKKLGHDTTQQERSLADLVAVTEARKRARGERKKLGYEDPDSAPH